MVVVPRAHGNRAAEVIQQRPGREEERTMRHVTSVLTTFALTVALAGPAFAGRCDRTARGKVTFDAIGVRLKAGTPAELAAGQTADTEVLSAAQLTAFGLKGVKEGDAIQVKAVEVGKRYEITHVASGQHVVLVVDDKGALSVMADGSVRPAAAAVHANTHAATPPAAAPAVKTP
jgi:hypothetical protein